MHSCSQNLTCTMFRQQRSKEWIIWNSLISLNNSLYRCTNTPRNCDFMEWAQILQDNSCQLTTNFFSVLETQKLFSLQLSPSCVGRWLQRANRFKAEGSNYEQWGDSMKVLLPIKAQQQVVSLIGTPSAKEDRQHSEISSQRKKNPVYSQSSTANGVTHQYGACALAVNIHKKEAIRRKGNK